MDIQYFVKTLNIYAEKNINIYIYLLYYSVKAKLSKRTFFLIPWVSIKFYKNSLTLKKKIPWKFQVFRVFSESIYPVLEHSILFQHDSFYASFNAIPCVRVELSAVLSYPRELFINDLFVTVFFTLRKTIFIRRQAGDMILSKKERTGP